MIRYKNISGKSGVLSYEIHRDHILVKFNTGKVYLFNYIKPGILIVDQMKRLATSGLGLNTFIIKSVRKNYYKKLQ